MDYLSLINQIKWAPVIVITIISFILGFLWHSPMLFGKAWKEEVNPNHKNTKVNFAMIFGLSAILHFIAIASLAAVIGKESSAISGLILGLIISIVWVSSTIGVTYIFAARSLKLFLIDAGFYIVFFSIAGLILGAW